MDIQLFHRALAMIRSARRILLVTHHHPDGDALASLSAMIEVMEREGKTYHAYCQDRPPRHYDFLPHVEKVSSEEIADFGAFDLIVVMDCGNLERTGLKPALLARASGQLVIEIDHHRRVDSYSDLELRDSSAAAACEIVARFIDANGLPWNRNLATAILAGLSTDTAFFFHPSATQDTMSTAARMMKLGGRLAPVVNFTWKNKQLGSLRLWGRALQNLRINQRYGIAVSVLTSEELGAEGAEDEELEGISSFIATLAGVKAALFIREESGGNIKGSLRSVAPDMDVARLAFALGGGGHTRAAGFTLPGRLVPTEDGWDLE